MSTQDTTSTRRPRAGTIIWGAVILAVGSLVLLNQLTDIRFDTGVVLMGLLVGTGAALVIGGALSMVRKDPSEPPS
ncbi:hypothetical protein [Arthrobacter sp. H41]|uniref:hypothetical protein n=1 Tax=Arthrobacter sp. H41 TaxID=1312978 RepID=UPI0004ADA1D1|nr:hypothetical protein [Arthrobacter sp. H41]